MLDETIGFCQAHPSSKVKDIRFVVYKKDQALITAFGQEMASLRSQRMAWSNVSKNANLSIEVVNGDLTKERSDAILNINSTNMDMKKAGALSKAILVAGGEQVQQECNQLGQQTPGSAVITTGGSLAVPRVIHIIPGWICIPFFP